MNLKYHCDECIRVLGKPFTEVHRFLDEFAEREPIKHRVHRHHQAGVEMVRRRWGDEAAKAAELHIKTDWNWHYEYKGEVPTREQATRWTNNLH